MACREIIQTIDRGGGRVIRSEERGEQSFRPLHGFMQNLVLHLFNSNWILLEEVVVDLIILQTRNLEAFQFCITIIIYKCSRHSTSLVLFDVC